jgi:hydroxyacylglutathione hydrolase
MTMSSKPTESTASTSAPQATAAERPIRVIPIETTSLGDRSYLAHDGDVAIVVDPQRDIDRVTLLAEAEGVRIGLILETHVHNDYVSGGLQLSRETGATYVLNADDPLDFERYGIRDGESIECGRMRVTALHTPGHTFTHLSFALHDDSGRTIGVFTGGGLLHGSTGRPDLLGQQHAEELARLQHASAHRLAEELPAVTPIHPTHGFGSFCSSTETVGSLSTIGDEIEGNPVLQQDADTYVRDLLAGLDAYPAYYRHMGPLNSRGPEPVDLSPAPRATAADIRAALDRGEWVVDLRDRVAFSQGHVPGTYSFGIDGSFATYLGWLFPYDVPLTLLGDSPEQVAEGQRELVRVGIDRIERMAHGPVATWTDGDVGRVEVKSFRDVPAALADGVLVLDVRRVSERRASHVADTVHVPLHELPPRMHEIPRDRPVWVHCASAYRASIAVSMMRAEGIDAVLIGEAYEDALNVEELDIREDVNLRAALSPSDVSRR